MAGPGGAESGRSDPLRCKGLNNSMGGLRPPQGEAVRFLTVDEVADLVEFLARRETGYITGQVIGINGGLYI